MSKRRNRKNRPNIPQSTLDRARIQAGLEAEGDVEDALAEGMGEEAAEGAEAVIERVEVARAESVTGAPDAPAIPRRRRRANASLNDLSVDEKKKLSSEMVAELLHNPTKTVSEEQLSSEYQHVLVDLRNMFVLAAVLIVLLVVLAQVL